MTDPQIEEAVCERARWKRQGLRAAVDFYEAVLRAAGVEWQDAPSGTKWRRASVDGRRMAETRSGSGRSPTSAVPAAEQADAQPPRPTVHP